MSQESVVVVRRGFEAWNAGNMKRPECCPEPPIRPD
jgi:hypothetical protein